MRRLIDNRHFFSVSSLINNSKSVIGWHARDVTANRHVGSWNWHQYTHRWEVKNDNTVWSHMLSRAFPPNIKDIKVCIYITCFWWICLAQWDWGHFHHNGHWSLCPLSMSTVVLVLLINYVRNFNNWKLEDLMVLKCSPDLLYYVKIGQDQLWLIKKHILFYGGCGHFGQVT